MVRTKSYRPSDRLGYRSSDRMVYLSGQEAPRYQHINRARTRRINIRPTQGRLRALSSAIRAPPPPPPPPLGLLVPPREEFIFDTTDEELIQAEEQATKEAQRRTQLSTIRPSGVASKAIVDLIGHPYTWSKGNYLSTAAKLFLKKPAGALTHGNGEINHKGQGLLVYFLTGNGISPKLIRDWFQESYPVKYRENSSNYKDIESAIWDYAIHQRTQFVLSDRYSKHVKPYWYDPATPEASRARLRELL